MNLGPGAAPGRASRPVGRLSLSELDHGLGADDGGQGGEELILHRGDVAVDGGSHAADQGVEGGVVGVRLLEGDEDGAQRVVVGLAPVGHLHPAGDDVAQGRVEDLQFGGGVGGELVEEAVGEREAVGPSSVADGGEQTGDHLVVVGDEFGEVGRHGPSPLQMRRRSVAHRVSSWRLESWSLRRTEETWVSTVLTDRLRRRATSL